LVNDKPEANPYHNRSELETKWSIQEDNFGYKGTIQIDAILASHGLSLGFDVIQEITAVANGTDIVQACLIEFCTRHGRATVHHATSFVSECLGGSHTNLRNPML
jgi:hypothetical protein